jgi:hypothetical protein
MRYVEGVKPVSSFAVVAASLLLGGVYQLAAETEAQANPYQAIVDRNPFGLRPPPPPAPVTPPTKPEPPPNLSFTGITGDGKGKKAWIMANIAGKQPPLTYYSLAEKEKQDDIEVVEINPKTEEVKILLRGEPATLTFKDNANKSKAVMQAAAIGQPGAPGVPNAAGLPQGIMPQPMGGAAASGPVMIGKNGVVVPNAGQPGQNSFITQPPGQANANFQAGMTDVTGQYNNGGGGVRSLPQRNIRTQNGQIDRQSGMETAAQQTAAALINNQIHEAKGIPMPPLPGVPPPQ